MAIDALVKPLLALPLFRGLTPLQLTEIVRRAERIIYRPGDALITENQRSDAAIIIISGNCVRIDDNGDTSQKSRGEVVPEGALIAELAMLIELIHTTTIIAQGPVKALRLTRQRILELMESDPALAQHFSACIISRLKLLAKDLKAIDTRVDDATIAPQLPPTRADQAAAAQAS
ncbi:cyclic nucleotide-binding domain-containing protein [Hyphomicrobium sp.]|jgi:CRP-like cAMP-binding protein|uniref:cyclic nucleotide-binding domain-containing protein n=1 Tax=Hyphomicrobium sp. TaxID=82 RepID=UPI0035645BDE